MLQDAGRLVGTAAAIPAGALFRTLQGLSTGGNAILDLEVVRWEDAMLRQHAIHKLMRAAADPSVAGLLLRLEAPPGSWASCQDLRATIQRVRKAGKPVYAFVESPGNALVWIASACDRVFLLPVGDVNLVGVGAELTFFGSLFDRLGIKPDFEAAGAYKSFGEPYTRSFASPANQEAIRAIIEDWQQELVAGIAEGRDLTVDQVRALLDRAPLAAQEALDAGLVDQLAYQDEMKKWLEEHHGGKAKITDFNNWSRRDAMLEWTEHWGEDPATVAIVHMDGPIVNDDRGPAIMVRARHVAPLLAKLREDDDVRAVILHVNSPGGSAVASDIIWREVDLLQRKKPVVACFEDVAASGGYYLAAPAAEIIARPATLTGSIGVFGGKLVLEEGFRRLGIHTQEVAAAPNATLFSSSRHFTEDQRVRFRESLQRFYDGFVQRVAAGRKQPMEAIEPCCRGRVWTGRAAQLQGLVDRQGDLTDAVERARILAGLHRGAFRRREISAQPNRSIIARALHGVIRSFIPGGAQARLLGIVERLLGARLTPALELVLTHPDQPLVLLPYEVEPLK